MHFSVDIPWSTQLHHILATSPPPKCLYKKKLLWSSRVQKNKRTKHKANRRSNAVDKPGSDLLSLVLKQKYHRRWVVSLSSSEWDRVWHTRHNCQANSPHHYPKHRLNKGKHSRQSGDKHQRHQTITWTLTFEKQANRAISTGKLHTSLHFHTQPINVVVFHGSNRDN